MPSARSGYDSCSGESAAFPSRQYYCSAECGDCAWQVAKRASIERSLLLVFGVFCRLVGRVFISSIAIFILLIVRWFVLCLLDA